MRVIKREVSGMRLFAIFVLFTLFSLNLSAGIGVDPSGKVHVHRNLPMEVEGSPLLRFDLEGMPHLNAFSPLVTFSVAVFVDREINKHYPSYDAPAPKSKPIWNPGPLNLSYSSAQLDQLFCQNMRDQFAAGRANPTWTFDNGRGWGHVGVVGQEYFDRYRNC